MPDDRGLTVADRRHWCKACAANRMWCGACAKFFELPEPAAAKDPKEEALPGKAEILWSCRCKD